MEGQSTVLIADDEPSARDTLEALLVREGYRLAFATNGPEALAKARELVPDLVLLDVMMPGMDGFEVCRRLRADPLLADVPVIMVTALDDRASRLLGIEAGADDFVSKPFNRLELRVRVHTVTRLHRQRRLRALELQAERDRTQAILEALGEAVVVADLDGTIQYVNPAFTALTGYTGEEALGANWYTWRRDHQSAASYTGMQEAIAAGRTWSGEMVSRRKDGTMYDAAMTAAPLFAPRDRDRPIGFVSVQRDITPLKDAQRLKDQFVSNVSHELRTPLSIITLISGNLDALYGRLDDNRRRKMILDIREHAQVLNELIDEVLEISRIEGGRMSMERERVDLAQLARDEMERQLPLIQRKSQTLCVAGVEQLPVWGHDGQLRRVIRNLLNNAIKYTHDGGQITCECRVRDSSDGSDSEWPGCAGLPPGRWAGLRVADTGIGIRQESLPHLFERFYRVEAQGNVPGTGLGLSIARDLVELHGGCIAVASMPGEGSVFAVYLPLPEED